MDFLDILDFLINPVIDFSLCGGDWDIWLKKRVTEFLLGAGILISIMILAFAIEFASVFWIIVGAIGTVFFVVVSFRYTFWWLRYGRFGADPPWHDLPWLDKLPIPRGDLMNAPHEDTPVHHAEPEDVWKDMGVR